MFFLGIEEIRSIITKSYTLPVYYDEKGYWKGEKEWSERYIYYLRDLFIVFSQYKGVKEVFEINYVPEGFTREDRA